MSRAVSAIVAVHIQPRAKMTEVVGHHGAAIKIRLKAPPVDGAANEELVRFLAEKLGVARSNVTIVGGATGRAKRVKVVGLSGAEVERRLVGT